MSVLESNMDNNPQVQYRTPDGQTMTSFLKDAPPQVQTLYNQNYLQPQANLQQTTAQIPGVAASSKKEQIGATQAASPQNLKADLTSGMTLKDALSKYTALGMSPDDVFTNYLSQSPRGLPHESLTELNALGISPKVTGNVGQISSFADKQNVKNNILGLRDLKDKFHQTGQFSSFVNNSGLANLGFDTKAAQAQAAYESARSLFTEHLSSLIPGASNASSDVATMAKSVPSSNDFRNYSPGKADAMFSSVEDQLLKAKGYSYKDLGIAGTSNNTPGTDSSTAQSPKGGGGLLSTLLENAKGDVGNIAKGIPALASQGVDLMRNEAAGPIATVADADPTGNARATLAKIGILPDQSTGQMAINQGKGIVNEYSDLIQNPQQHALEHPVNTALDMLPFLAGAKAISGVRAAEGAEAAGAATEDSAASFKAPNKFQQIIDPTGSKNAVGDQRQAVIKAGQNSGNIKSGDAIAADWQKWGETAKAGNVSDADAIDKAVAAAQKIYGGKTFTPQQLYDSYKQIENGYSVKGIPKAATNAYIDRASQDILQKHLEDVAPGFKATTDMFSKIYGTEKGQASKIVKNLPSTVAKGAINAGLNAAGLGVLREFLGL